MDSIGNSFTRAGYKKGYKAEAKLNHTAHKISKQKKRTVFRSLCLEKRFNQAATSLRRGCPILRTPLPLEFWLRMNATYGLDSFKP